jgi:hypothetical protein
MFRPNCRAIFKLIFEQMECTIGSAFNLQYLVLQELGKLTAVCYEGYPESNLRFGIKKNPSEFFFIIYIWKPQS